MQAIALVSSLLLVAALAAAAPSQPEQPSSGSVSSPVVVGNSPSSSNQVEGQQPSTVVVDHSHVVHQHQPGYYSPVVVSGQQEAVQAKPPVHSAGTVDQYGQPESQALPPNYKPFGSWGLYIGGNPADGYYTNYYKALTNSVDKQQVGSVEPAAVKPVGPIAAQSPVLTRQAAVVPGSPYVGGDFYSFAYSPSDLNSALPVHTGQQQPAQVGQFYGSPASPVAAPVDPASQYGSISPYSDFYATKKIGQAVQREVSGQVPKGHHQLQQHQQRSYYYQYPAAGPIQMAAPLPAVASPVGQQQKTQQVVSYPVPVGSQIVGSQPGVDGSFDPYGIHAFTRYAVKPTVVSQSDSGYYYSYPSQQQHVVPSYKHQPVYSVPVHSAGSSAAYSPYYGFYGYPVNQLHYSQGLIVPVQSEQSHQQHHHQAEQPATAAASPNEPSSDKAESADQLKPQK